MKRSKAIEAAALVAAGIGVYGLVLRPWHLKWGATDGEAREPLPGDDLITNGDPPVTHAVTIQAPPEDVWPWLVQLGREKGGFYSYAVLENLIGCQITNAAEIRPEWQHIEVGDLIHLHPSLPPIRVMDTEPNRRLVLADSQQPTLTWSFNLRPEPAGGTRLVVRARGAKKPGPLNRLLILAVFEPAHFIMERKMLLTLKRLAESCAYPAAKPV